MGLEAAAAPWQGWVRPLGLRLSAHGAPVSSSGCVSLMPAQAQWGGLGGCQELGQGQ